MHLFISWSGQRSKLLAEVLRDLVPDILPGVEPWMSQHDIKAGDRWSAELAERLAITDVGIACITPENQTAPWLIFEAGAISKSLKSGRLVPLLMDLAPDQIAYPLAQFQLQTCAKDGMARLIQDLNLLLPQPVEVPRLNRQFIRWWPDFQQALALIPAPTNAALMAPSRTDQDVLHEILERIRDLAGPTAIAATGYDHVWIDTRPLTGKKNGATIIVERASSLSVSDLLDQLWYHIHLQADVPAYTYGKRWTLYNTRTRTLLSSLGKEYIESSGAKRDKRRLEAVGITLGDKLELRPI